MATLKKQQVLKDLTDKFSRAKSVVFCDYQGLTHKQLEDLRKTLKESSGQLLIAKNTLFLRALSETEAKTAIELGGASAALFAYKDEVAPLKELVKFFKTATKGKLKNGLLNNKLLSPEEVEQLSKLPTREILTAMLLTGLQSPIYGLHNALTWNLKKLVWVLESVKSVKGKPA